MGTDLVLSLRNQPTLRKLVYSGMRARCQQLLAMMQPCLGSGPILDVGSGTCNLTELLKEQSADVTALDVTDISFIPGITPVLYDGLHFPFPDHAFDTALIITVLHHASDPDQVLREAARVARRVIVIEDVVKNGVHHKATAAWDSIMNLEFSGHPHNNRTDQGWQEAFAAAGLNLVERKSWWSFLIMWQVMYLLERA